MLSKKDIALLRGMFQEQETRLEGRLSERLTTNFGEYLDIRFSEFKREVRDEIHSCISASEKRTMSHLEDRLHEVKTEIIDGMTDILDEFVLPPIAQLQTDMVRVKDRIQMA